MSSPKRSSLSSPPWYIATESLLELPGGAWTIKALGTNNPPLSRTVRPLGSDDSLSLQEPTQLYLYLDFFMAACSFLLITVAFGLHIFFSGRNNECVSFNILSASFPYFLLLASAAICVFESVLAPMDTIGAWSTSGQTFC